MKKSEINFVAAWVGALDGEARLNESQIDQLQRLAQYCVECDIGFEIKTGNAFENVPMHRISELSARYHGVPVESLTDETRNATVVRARDFAMLTIYDSRQISLKDVANFFGRDHTKLVHTRQKVTNTHRFAEDLAEFQGWLIQAISGRFVKAS